MKSTLFLATGALFCISANAQLLNQQKDHYCTITGLAAAETFFSNQGKGGLEVSFPYQVTNASGATADSVFHSRVIHPFSAVKVYIVHLGVDLGDRRQFAGVHFSPVLMGEGSVSSNLTFNFDYGRNFYFGRRPKAAPNEKRFVLKPSLGVLYAGYKGTDAGSPTFLGAIPNKDRSIAFPGGTAGPTYTYTTGGYNTPTNSFTDSTSSLNIYYGQREWSLQPKIAIGTNQFAGLVYIEIYAAYTFALWEKGKVYFMQDDTHQVAMEGLNQSQLTVQYNNAATSSTPYHLNGWSFGIAMGMNIKWHGH
jgi:hypothetical protein